MMQSFLYLHMNTFSVTTGMALIAFLFAYFIYIYIYIIIHTITLSQPPKQECHELKEIPASQSIRKVERVVALFPSVCECACQDGLNSHFLAISTETGYLFLLTAPVLNIKPQVPPHVSCPGHNPRHQAIPPAPGALDEGRASAHKQTPSISSLSPSSAPNRPCIGQTAAQIFSNFCKGLFQPDWDVLHGWGLHVLEQLNWCHFNQSSFVEKYLIG